MTYYVILAVFAAVVSCSVLLRLYNQLDAAALKPEAPRPGLSFYEPVIDPALILTMFLLSAALLFAGRLLAALGLIRSAYAFSSKFGGILLNLPILLLVYYTVMLPVFPALKRALRPASCAALWILPNVLYAFWYLNLFFSTEQSYTRWVVRIRGTWPLRALGIWLAGFVLLLGRSLLSHLLFRRKLLADAAAWDDPRAQDKWKTLKQEYGVKENRFSRPLYRSVSLSTPLSIGLRNASTYVILPENKYTEEDLDLILRHELLHLIRRDPQAKLFLRFTQALFWFWPLTWFSSRSLSEDLERSCDELVLGDAPDETRRRYAALLLQSTADARGFTTCLSADGRSLKARLQDVLHPAERRKGILLILLMTLVLLLFSGRFAAAYGEGRPLKDELLSGEEYYPDEWKTVFLYETADDRSASRYKQYVCRDPEAFARAVEDLPVYRTLGVPGPGDGPMIVSDPVSFGGARTSGVRVTQISRNYLYYTGGGTYYVETEDWERLFALFEEVTEEAQ